LPWWLIAASSGATYFEWVSWFMGTIIGRVVLLGYTWALLHHMLGGLRHLLWDLGYGFEKSFSTKLAKANLAGSVVLTLVVWIIGYMVRF